MNIRRGHGQGGKPIWLGEFGIQEADLNDPNQQALLRGVLTAEAPIAMAQWYSLRDDFPMTCCPAQKIKHEFYGLTTHDYVKKQGYETMRGLLTRRRP